MSDDSHVLFGVTDGVGHITLNRPERLNSFTKPMLERVLELVETCARDAAIRCVLLTGAGRAFCAGQDLGDRSVAPGEEPLDLGESLHNRYNPIVRLLLNMPKPVVVAVNGVAAGAGANLALAGDIVVAARSARFIESFVRLGLVPDAGGTFVLPRLVGMARARAIAMLGEPVSAEQAEEWGMIWRTYDDEALADEAMSIATQLAAGPTGGLAKTKRVLNLSLGNTLDDQLDLERDTQRAAGLSKDYTEGVQAFMDKREPRFVGE